MTPTERMASRPFGLIASLILHVAPQRAEEFNISFGLKDGLREWAASGAKRSFATVPTPSGVSVYSALK
jgi:hypothetical protein